MDFKIISRRKVMLASLGIGTIGLLAACSSQYYYNKSNLNNIAIGQSKTDLLNVYTGGGANNIPPMTIRAAQNSDDGLIEVGEMYMTDSVTAVVAYWFLFEDGKLKQWGRPEDWKAVQTRYEINYNPSIGVTN